MNTPPTTTKVRVNVMTAIAALGCVVSIVGVLLPWQNLTVPALTAARSPIPAEVSGHLSIPGTDTADGKIILGLAFAALAVIVAFRFTAKRWLSIIALLLGAVIATTGIADTVSAENNAPELARVFLPTYSSVGPGLYVTILGGSTLVAAATCLSLTASRQPRHREPPEQDRHLAVTA